MIDFNFNTRLVTNVFGRNYQNIYETEILTASNILLLNPRFVPMVKLKGELDEPKTPFDILMVANANQFGRKALNKEKVYEILNTAHYPLLITITGIKYYVGKGFIGKWVDGDVVPIFVMTIPGQDYCDDMESDITIITTHTIGDETQIIKSIIQQCLREATGDIFYTGQISKFLSGKLRLPRFANIRAQKEYTETFIGNLIDAL